MCFEPMELTLYRTIVSVGPVSLLVGRGPSTSSLGWCEGERERQGGGGDEKKGR